MTAYSNTDPGFLAGMTALYAGADRALDVKTGLDAKTIGPDAAGPQAQAPAPSVDPDPGFGM